MTRSIRAEVAALENLVDTPFDGLVCEVLHRIADRLDGPTPDDDAKEGWAVAIQAKGVVICKHGKANIRIDKDGLSALWLDTVPHSVMDRAWVEWLRIKDGG